MKKFFVSLCSLFFIFGVSGNVFGITFNDFSSTEGLTFNGSSTTTTTGDGEILRLTPSLRSQSGSVFSSAMVNASDFSTFFEFRITDPGGPIFDGNPENGADGLVFVVQSVSSDMGGAGEGIGYAGISNSVGVEFDTWHNSWNNDPDSNHVGIDINGSVNHGSGSPNTVSVTPNFDDGNLWYSWIDYNGSDLEVRVNQTGIRPDDPLLSQSLDIAMILGEPDAYVGFTSGTGADWGNHDIISWEYRDGYDPVGVNPDPSGNPVPEPSTIFLLGSGLAGLICYRRKNSEAAHLRQPEVSV